MRRGGREVEVLRIGMGPVRATAARSRLARLAPGRAIVLFGFAGGLTTRLRAGDLVVANSCAGIEEEEEPVALPHAADVAALIARAGPPGEVHLAPVVSTPKVLRGAAERARLAQYGALAVDMESRWCAPLAERHPFAVVRAVLDVPGREVLSPATPMATWKAYRSLVWAARTLRDWSPVPMNDDCKVGDR